MWRSLQVQPRTSSSTGEEDSTHTRESESQRVRREIKQGDLSVKFIIHFVLWAVVWLLNSMMNWINEFRRGERASAMPWREKWCCGEKDGEEKKKKWATEASSAFVIIIVVCRRRRNTIFASDGGRIFFLFFFLIEEWQSRLISIYFHFNSHSHSTELFSFSTWIIWLARREGWEKFTMGKNVVTIVDLSSSRLGEGIIVLLNFYPIDWTMRQIGNRFFALQYQLVEEFVLWGIFIFQKHQKTSYKRASTQQRNKLSIFHSMFERSSVNISMKIH